jgi:DNA-binding response OmpR family regulator
MGCGKVGKRSRTDLLDTIRTAAATALGDMPIVVLTSEYDALHRLRMLGRGGDDIIANRSPTPSSWRVRWANVRHSSAHSASHWEDEVQAAEVAPAERLSTLRR